MTAALCAPFPASAPVLSSPPPFARKGTGERRARGILEEPDPQVPRGCAGAVSGRRPEPAEGAPRILRGVPARASFPLPRLLVGRKSQLFALQV